MIQLLEKCYQCTHHRTAYSEVLCCAQTNVVPAKTARHHLSACGPEAKLFEQKTARSYSEHER